MRCELRRQRGESSGFEVRVRAPTAPVPAPGFFLPSTIAAAQPSTRERKLSALILPPVRVANTYASRLTSWLASTERKQLVTQRAPDLHTMAAGVGLGLADV